MQITHKTIQSLNLGRRQSAQEYTKLYEAVESMAKSGDNGPIDTRRDIGDIWLNSKQDDSSVSLRKFTSSEGQYQVVQRQLDDKGEVLGKTGLMLNKSKSFLSVDHYTMTGDFGPIIHDRLTINPESGAIFPG